MLEIEQIFGTKEQTYLQQAQPALPAYKKVLASCTEQLTTAFQQHAPIDTIVRGRATIIDRMLCLIWQQHFDQTEGIALVAVGGYGRGELHPCSDIDLLILIQDTPDTFNTAIEQFVMFLWDIGLEVGNSVRTFEECLQEATKDVTVITNLLESRHLCGDQPLFSRLATQVTQTWQDYAFYQAKKQEQAKRYLKYHDTAYNLEPNLKDGPGGLRDIQTLGWIAKRHFGVYSMQALMDNGFLTKDEFDVLRDARAFLWSVRYALHSITKRHEDRLLFDHQPSVAEQLGFLNDTNQADVERLMQRYYRTVMTIERLNEMLLQLLEEAVLKRPIEKQPLNDYFCIQNNYLDVTSNTVFEQHPSALLEAFLLLQQNPQLSGIRATTIRLFRQYRYLIDNTFRASPTNQALFLSILRQPHGLTRVLRKMNRYGILAAYLPVFEKIVGQMQYDLFHHYTVDEHTLFVIRNLRRMTVPKFRDELPYLSHIMTSIPKPELLYLAALFHDIGKGRGGDHAKLGAVDAEAFCQTHHLGRQDTHLIRWLVENHLVMSVTAQRKDISDPEIVYAFAQKVSNLQRLKYLYLLTVADIRATNPTLWNGWKGNLLQTLYKAARNRINAGLDLPVDQANFVHKTKLLARSKLYRAGLSDTAIDQVWQNLDGDYFLHCNEAQIAWHTQAIHQHPDHSQPLVSVHNPNNSGSTEVFIHMQDTECLFAVATAVIGQLCLNIADAWLVTTLDQHTLDSFHILSEDGQPITDADQIQTLTDKLNAALQNIKHYPLNISRRISRQIKHFEQSTSIRFSQDPKTQRSVVSIYATDKPGLLSSIGLAFSELNINLHNAKISTVGARCEDWFYISDHAGKPITDTETLDKLEKLLISLIEGKTD